MHMKQQRIRICVCSTALVFIAVGLLSNTFSVYFPFFIESYRFTNTDTSMLVTIRNLTSMLSMLTADRYYRRFGLRRGTAAALAAAVLSFLIYGLTDSMPLCFLAAAISGICYGLGGMIPASILIHRWYPDHSATAIGIAASGSGIASVLCPVLITRTVTALGLSAAFLLEAGFMALLTVPILLLMKERPDSEEKEGGKQETAADDSRPQAAVLTAGEQHLAFFAVVLTGVLGLTSFSGLPLLFTTTGHSALTVSFLMSLFGFLLIAGKTSFGITADRFGSRTAVTVFGLFLTAGHVLCCFTQNAPFLQCALTISLLGIGMALTTAALPVIAGDFAPDGQYDRFVRNYQIAFALGGILSGPIPGLLADRTGSYLPACCLHLAVSVLLLAILLPVYRRSELRKKERKENHNGIN